MAARCAGAEKPANILPVNSADTPQATHERRRPRARSRLNPENIHDSLAECRSLSRLFAPGVWALHGSTYNSIRVAQGDSLSPPGSTAHN